MYTLNTVDPVCPAKFNSKNSAFCPHNVFDSCMSSDYFVPV